MTGFWIVAIVTVVLGVPLANIIYGLMERGEDE